MTEPVKIEQVARWTWRATVRPGRASGKVVYAMTRRAAVRKARRLIAQWHRQWAYQDAAEEVTL